MVVRLSEDKASVKIHGSCSLRVNVGKKSVFKSR